MSELGRPPLAGAPPGFLPCSVAVDAHGTVFATGDLGNVLYRITKR